MKRLSFCLAILLLLSAGFVQAQTAGISVKSSAIEGAVLKSDRSHVVL